MNAVGTGASLSEAKAALLRQWQQGGSVPLGEDAPIPRAASGPVPLSYAQQRLWFLEQLVPGSAAYNLSHCVLLDGRLEPELLSEALQDLAQRHDTVRTVVRMVDGEPRQVVDSAAHPALDVVDLRDLDPDRALATARDRARSAADVPMDIAAGPLARLILYQLPDKDMMLVVVHHLIGDGWALSVALHELGACYQSRAAGREPALEPLPVRFADLAAHEQSSGADFAAEIEFWTDRLAGLRPLRLPADRTPSATLDFAGDWVPVQIDDDVERRLRAFATRHDATPYMMLLATYSLLLAGMTGERDIAVAGAVAGRDRPETQPLLGNLTNTVVIRSTVDTRATFAELLAAVRRDCLDALAHQRVPFERLVDELNLSGNASTGGPVSVSFVLQPPSPVTDFAGIPLEPVQLGWTSARADLELLLSERPNLSGGLVFRRGVLSGDAARLLAARLTTTLRTVLAAPDAPLRDLDLLPAAETRRIADLATGPDRSILPVCVHELITRRARNTPAAAAVSWSGGRMTRHRLETDANRLAHRLIGLDLGVEDPVAVCLERGPDLPVAALGVLKAGGTYLPLDPVHASARLAKIVTDSGASILIADAATAERLASAGVRLTTVVVDEGGTWLGDGPELPPRHRTTPDNLAYLIYTSGSTGEPKGVEVSHRSVVNYLTSLTEEHGIGADDVVAAVASPGFDASAAELFGGLAIAGRVHMVPQADLADAGGLSAALVAGECTVLSATPTMWRLLSAAPDGLSRLRLTALVGGEVVGERLADELATTQRSAWTQYGPTEATVWVTVGRLTARDQVSMGTPIRNTEIHLLDAELRPVPLGAVGEVCVAGAAIARGYRGLARLTAEAFVPHPFGGAPGARLYRSGDYARYRADGSLQFVGRRDDQVKVRGHRVELGEIEAVLGGLSGVRECAVAAVASSTVDDPPKVVAYVCGGWAALYQDNELVPAVRRGLRERLPAHLVPDRIVQLDELPKTATGKVDRARLPEPGRAGRSVDTPFVAPRTELEKGVAAAVAEFLELDQVGMHDDFFDLGGNSVGAAQLVLHLQDRFGVELVLQKLIGALTVARLAQTIQQDLDRQTQLFDSTGRIQHLVEGLTEEKVDALLSTLLAQRGQRGIS